MNNATYSVICVALSLDGVVNGSVIGGIQGAITRTNADGSSDTFGGGADGWGDYSDVTAADGLTGAPGTGGAGAPGVVIITTWRGVPVT